MAAKKVREPCSRMQGRVPLAPIRLPESVFEEVLPPITDSDGKVRRRWRLKGSIGTPFEDFIGEEQRMNQTFKIGPIERKPMVAPVGSVFYIEYEYGKVLDKLK